MILSTSLRNRIVRLMEGSPYRDVSLSSMIHMLLRIGVDVEERVRGIQQDLPLPEWITEILDSSGA